MFHQNISKLAKMENALLVKYSHFGGKKCDCLIFKDFSLLLKKLGLGSICYDPKKKKI